MLSKPRKPTVREVLEEEETDPTAKPVVKEAPKVMSVGHRHIPDATTSLAGREPPESRDATIPLAIITLTSFLKMSERVPAADVAAALQNDAVDATRAEAASGWPSELATLLSRGNGRVH